MKYISKGIVAEGSTEHILKIQWGGYEFQLTGDRARLWLNDCYKQGIACHDVRTEGAWTYRPAR